MTVRKVLFFSLLLLFSAVITAQNPDDAAKEKLERERRLLEQITADAKSLRLPENRAYVFARVGGELWQRDEKAARKLIQEAIGDLIAGQNEASNEKPANRQYFQNLVYGQSPRYEIINFVAARDAELALECLVKSRPALVAEALQTPKNQSGSPIEQFARAEFNLEQRLIGMAAEQNPSVYVKKLQESLKKGFSYETFDLLNRLYAKDPQIADKLAEEAAGTFLSIDYTNYSASAEAAGYFVAAVGRPRAAEERSLKIPDELLRRVLTKMTDDWLKAANSQMYGYNNCAELVERLFPDRAARLKKKLQQLYAVQPQTEENERYAKLVSGETTAEEMLAQAENFQTGFRSEIYRAAAGKFAEKGNVAEAERILRGGISDEQAENYLMQLYVNLSYQSAGQGKFSEAVDFASRIADDDQRAQALINVANSAYSRNQQENQKTAAGILAQARALIPNPPETQSDLNAAIQLATAYAQFDADEAFRVLEGALPVINEVNQANFVLMKFRSYGGAVRNGEWQISNGNNLGGFNLENTLRTLKEKDFERTLQFSGGLNRPETRIWLLLCLFNDNGSQVSLKRRSFIYSKIDRPSRSAPSAGSV
ncbi:MAG TPA: hypothetical protein VIL74_21470 [Pyrinomonadaceae bacterium]|jgi:hypothetical protein